MYVLLLDYIGTKNHPELSITSNTLNLDSFRAIFQFTSR